MKKLTVQERETVDAVERHARAMASRDPAVIADDYAEDAIIICSLEDKPAIGKAEITAMIGRTLETTVGESFSGENEGETILDEVAGEFMLHIFQSRAAGLFGVESYVVRDQKIVFESVDIRPLDVEKLDTDKKLPSPENSVMEVVQRHARRMGSMDADVIASDYAENAVVIATLADGPAVGHPAVRDMIADILETVLKPQTEQALAEGVPAEAGDEWSRDIVAGDYCLHLFLNRALGSYGVETYLVQNDKIVFESADLRPLG